MKPSLIFALPLLVSLSLAACAVDPTAAESDEGTPAAEGKGDENVGQTKSELRALDPTKYCLPGEVVKCTLGPPPVCHCELPTKTAVSVAW